jgi:hypothetical protein
MLDRTTDPVAAAILAGPNHFADTFARIHAIASRKQDCDVCAASCISNIESIAERIERATGGPDAALALAVRMICNSPFSASDQMDAIAAATEARAAVLQAVA